MWAQVACEALSAGKVLNLRYDGYDRCVEVHAVGVTKEGHVVMRCWQVSGGSESDHPVGWKLLRLDKATSAVISDQGSMAPRSGYNPPDRAMAGGVTCCL